MDVQNVETESMGNFKEKKNYFSFAIAEGQTWFSTHSFFGKIGYKCTYVVSPKTIYNSFRVNTNFQNS